MLREAAVLVPVYRRQDGGLMVVLVRRAHGGQLALPGGQREPADADLAATALREANEEFGLVGDRVELLAALPVVETRTAGFRWPRGLGRDLPDPGAAGPTTVGRGMASVTVTRPRPPKPWPRPPTRVHVSVQGLPTHG